MGKRRNTAKTGDKAMYNSRMKGGDQSSSSEKKNKLSYDEQVDQFHHDRDMIRLGGDASDDESNHLNDGISHQHAIMDLGAGGDDDSSSSSSDSDDDDDDSSRSSEQEDDDQDIEQERYSSSDDDDSDLDVEKAKGDPRQWGRKKSAYYHGDTADLEIGQEEDDAFLEEEAAKEIQSARFAEMDEDDFVLSDDDGDDDGQAGGKSDAGSSHKTESISILASRDVSKLTKAEKQNILKHKHSELLPIVSYFSDVVKELKEKTSVAQKALFDGDEETAEAVGATIKGKEYLLTKTLLQSSMALNAAMYLILKSEQEDDMDDDLRDDSAGSTNAIQAHPVMARLEQLNSLSQKLSDSVESKNVSKGGATLSEQVENLVKAAAMMGEAGGEVSSDSEEETEENDSEVAASTENKKHELEMPDSGSDENEEESMDGEKELEAAEEQRKAQQAVLNEAKFGLRQNEVDTSSNGGKRKRRKVVFDDDVGEADDADAPKGSFLSTINSIEQRAKSKQKKKVRDTEAIDDLEGDDDELRQGLRMMEEEMGRLSDEEDMGPEMSDPDGEDGSGMDNELDDDDDLGYYNKMAQESKDKKARKKSKYAVAPKYPRVENEIEGERAISRQILKNRGLVAHKNKLNRNPRVKKREQYRKAQIRRKGAVREVRTNEGHKYAGEETGIKSGLSRSRKLIS